MSKDILMPLRRLHGWLHEYPAYCAKRKELLGTYVSQLREQLRRQPKSVFLVMTPEHGNLGDHAIASAEIRMLREAGIDYIEVTDRQLKSLYCTNLLSVMNGYPIIINGGGNMGTLWFDVERLHRAVIRSNPKSPIFIFPNTIYYEDSDWGAEEFQNSIRIYNRHRSLFLYAREKLSYEVMKDAYRNVKLVPDIVLSLDESGRDTNRQGCLLCLRRDLEKIRTGEQEQLIRDQATELFWQCRPGYGHGGARRCASCSPGGSSGAEICGICSGRAGDHRPASRYDLLRHHRYPMYRGR